MTGRFTMRCNTLFLRALVIAFSVVLAAQRQEFAPSVIVALSGVASLNAAAQTVQSTSTVAGCITDTIGQPLPGVTVDVGGSTTHRIVVSNSTGCYMVTDVPSGSYFVFARLQGFISVTRDSLTVAPGRSQTVNLRMRVAPICECI